MARPRKPARAAAAGLACFAALAAGCSRQQDAAAIVLVTLDTTRADRLGCYGYPRASTPHLDAFAAEALRFDQAESPVPVTLPSHASMFTGQYPAVHGVRYNGMFKLSARSVTVAERLRDAGWTTGAIPAAFPVTKTSGLDQGFETYDDLFAGPDAKKLPLNAERKAEDVSRLGIEWMQRMKGGKFFLWLHFYDPHAPYVPPFPYSAEYRDHPYDGEITYVDHELGKVFEWLRANDLWDRTLVLVAGDHGEGLYEHGEKLHCNLVYQSTLRVPLILKAPGPGRGRTVAETVSLVDVAPTILDYAGLSSPEGIDGISLRPAARGEALPRRDLHFESLAASLVYGWSPLEGIRRGKWKYTRSSSPELYDLVADPGESSNLYGTEGSLAADLDAALAADLARFAKTGSSAEATAAPLDRDALDRLASLGYVGGTVSAERRGGPHPKDLIFLEAEIDRARMLHDAEDWDAALQGWRTVLKADPANRYALLQASIVEIKRGDLDAARRFAEELTRRYPEFVPGAIALGNVRLAQGDLGGAEAAFREGYLHDPKDAGLAYRYAAALLARDRATEAVKVIDPRLFEGEERGSFLMLRSLAAAKLGDGPGAEGYLRQAVAAGYGERGTLESEPILEPLRKLPGFAEIVGGIQRPSASPQPARPVATAPPPRS